MTGVRSTEATSSASGVNVRPQQSFAVNGRIRFGNDSFTFLDLQGNTNSNISLLRLNYALGTLATAKDKLGELLGLTDELLELAEDASLESTSNSKRKSIDRRFQDKVEDFQELLDDSSKDGVDFLNKKELKGLLEFAGLDEELAGRLSSTFKRLAGVDSVLGYEDVKGTTVRYKKKVRDQNPLRNHQVTQEAANAGQGIPFLKTTDSVTRNIQFETAAQYGENSAGNSLLGTATTGDTISLGSDLADYNQRFLAADGTGLLALVATGDADKAVLQFYSMANPNAITHYSTITTLDTAYDSVIADVAPDLGSYAYLNEAQTTLHYNAGTDESLSVSGGTISQLDVVNGKIFFTSNATSLGANGSEDDLFYFDPTAKSPTPTRIAASTYSNESLATIEAFTTTADGSRIAFTINEGSDSGALAAGTTKDLVLLEVSSGDYSRLENTALYNLTAPTGSTSNYKNVAFDSSGNTIYVAQQEVGNSKNKSVAQYDVTDIKNPIFFAPQATGVFDAPLAVDTAQQFFLGDAKVHDLNGDGKLDVIGTFTDQDLNTGIATYLGNGNGTFQSVSTQSSLYTTTGLFAVGDITENGHSDIISVETLGGAWNYLILYEGSVDGDYAAESVIGIPSISEIALADADHDGTLDLFTASSGVSTSEVYYREGLTGSFNSPTTVSITDQTIEDLQLHDVNGDGNLDIITSGASRTAADTPTLAVQLGSGSGTFGSTITTNLLSGGGIGVYLATVAFTIGDVNGDGTADAISLMRGSSDSQLSVTQGNGDGTFQTATNYGVSIDATADAQVELRDVNNDSIQDILVNGSAGGSGVLYVLEGRGDGTFAPAVTSTSADTSSNFFGVGDFDNDNIIDVLQAGTDSASGSATDPEFTIRLGGISQSAATGTFSSASSITSNSSITLTSYPGTFGSENTGQAFTYTSLGTPRLTDLDGDGNLDAVMTFTDTTSAASGLVSFLGNADGTFQTPVTSGDDGGFTVDGMTLGDFDGDSNVDAFVSSGTGLYFWSGQGDGTFAVNITSAAGTSSIGDAIELQSGDIDGDGNLDVTISGKGKSGPAIENFFGDGSGGFGSQASQAVGGATTRKDGLVVADVTGDGAAEIIIGTEDAGTATITTLINSGTGTFSSSTSNSFAATSITGLDVGSTGLSANQDLVASATTSTGQLAILFAGDGSGTFTTSFSEANSGEVSGNIQFQDLDNDSVLDIVQGGRLQSGTTNGVVRAFLNNGSGTYSASTSYESGSASAGLALAASDFDGDGPGDVFYAGADGSTGYYTRLGETSVTNSEATTAVMADFDGDGQMDILSGLSNGSYTALAMQFGNSDATFDTAITSTLSQAGSVTALATADINGDGTPDLIFTSSGTAASGNSNVVGYATGVGDGTFSGITTIVGTPDIYALQVGDVTGDGNADIITGGNRAGAGEIQVFSGDGTGGFNLASPTTTYGTGKSISALSLFDIEGDGDTDIIATEVDNLMNGYVRTYLNGGSGTFTASATTSTSTVVTFANTNMLRGDLNNDGEVDIVVTSTGSTSPTGNASVLFGDGDGTFTLSQTYAQEAGGTTRAVLTDLNRDGQLDLLTSGTNDSGEASIRLGVRDGTFRARTTLDPGTNAPVGLFTADLNNDGDDEFVATQSPSSGNLLTTVREPSYGTAGTIIRTGNTTPENITASTTSTIFGFTNEQSNVEEFFATTASEAYGKSSNLVGGSNKALTLQLSAEDTNDGGANIFNPQLGGLYGTELFYSTTANYGSTNPEGLEGFTKQTLSLAGVESTKVELSSDNAIVDISSNGRYALIEDKNDDARVRSLRVYDLETNSVTFDVGEFIYDQANTNTHSAVLSVDHFVEENVNVAYTRPGDTKYIYTVSSSAPNTITSRAVDGTREGDLISYDAGYVYSAKNGSPKTGKLYVTAGFSPDDEISTIDLGDGRSATMSATSISANGKLLATTDETKQLYLVESPLGPTIHDTTLGNVLETSISADAKRVAVLQLSDSTYTVSLYRTSNNELIHMDSTEFDEATTEIKSLSMNGNGTQISVVRRDGEGNEEVFRAIDTTKKVTDIIKTTTSVSLGINETINPLKHTLTDVGYSMLASETVRELRKEIEADLKDVTKVLDELSTTIRSVFKNGPSELRALSKGYSTEALQKFAQNVAEQIRTTSYETLLLTNELDQGTALKLLRDSR